MLLFIAFMMLGLSVGVSGVFVTYNAIFFLGALCVWSWSGMKPKGDRMKNHRFAVLVPAHNEEQLIGKLIESALRIEYPKEKHEVIIIADNCTDRTAELAAEGGIKCLIRTDDSKRGKPYALDWALKQLNLDEYDAFVIIDADTVIDSGFLKAMNRKLNTGAEAIQGYFDLMNPSDSWLTRIAVVPGILKFRMRYFVKEKLKLSCPLMGNGMCFSGAIIRKYGWNAFSITENWEYYIKLTLSGYRVSYEQDARIFSHAVTALSHGESQRKRWVKGQLSVLFDHYKALLRKIVTERSVVSLDALMELVLPSYSLLFSWTLGNLVILFLLSRVEPEFLIFRNWAAVLVFAQAVYFLAAVALSKPSLKTWMALFFLPIFISWKIVVSAKALIGLKKRPWEKTDRRL